MNAKKRAGLVLALLVALSQKQDVKTAEASGLFMCNCSLTCEPKHSRVGSHGAYHALTESAASTMCIGDAIDSCLKRHGGTSTSDRISRCR